MTVCKAKGVVCGTYILRAAISMSSATSAGEAGRSDRRGLAGVAFANADEVVARACDTILLGPSSSLRPR